MDARERTDVVADGVMSVPEASQFAGLSRSAIYNYMESGHLAYVKLGRRRMIPRRALVELLSRSLVMRSAMVAGQN